MIDLFGSTHRSTIKATAQVKSYPLNKLIAKNAKHDSENKSKIVFSTIWNEFRRGNLSLEKRFLRIIYHLLNEIQW